MFCDFYCFNSIIQYGKTCNIRLVLALSGQASSSLVFLANSPLSHQSSPNQPSNPPTAVPYPDSHLIVLQATGQEKQIKPISGVEITLKITTANVEIYYLHPLNPIYFMHILPSKLNMARSLYRKSLWEDSLLSYHRLIVGIALSNHAQASKCAGFCAGLSHCVLTATFP